MLNYKDFETLVVGYEPMENEKWKHILPAVPLAHRHRFVKTYEKGFDIPTCFDLVMTSQTIKEKEYEDFLNKMSEKQAEVKVNKHKSPV